MWPSRGWPIVGILVLTIAGKVGEALAPRLLHSYPELLLALNANDAHLALTCSMVGVNRWFTIGFFRRTVEDPMCFFLGWHGHIDWLIRLFPVLAADFTLPIA